MRVLLADDDPDDRMLVQEALDEAGFEIDLTSVKDGEELLSAVRRDGNAGTLPSMILLDLNMPRKDGREALRELKEDRTLRCIPVVVLTTSRSDDDVAQTYRMGVNSYIIKPASFGALVDAMKVVGQYWCKTVTLPPSAAGETP
jgi:CheY-like chemotaxis protein